MQHTIIAALGVGTGIVLAFIVWSYVAPAAGASPAA